jgi:hypothetical protein
MALEVLRREFDVGVSAGEAWDVLARVEDWPSWAPHIKQVTVTPAGPLGPTSAGALRLRGGPRSTFKMAEWDPPTRWTWVGPMAWLKVHYDHQFAPIEAGHARLTWVVSLSGPGARAIRPIFGRIYARNVDRAIPRLQDQLAARRARRVPNDLPFVTTF